MSKLSQFEHKVVNALVEMLGDAETKVEDILGTAAARASKIVGDALQEIEQDLDSMTLDQLETAVMNVVKPEVQAALTALGSAAVKAIIGIIVAHI